MDVTKKKKKKEDNNRKGKNSRKMAGGVRGGQTKKFVNSYLLFQLLTPDSSFVCASICHLNATIFIFCAQYVSYFWSEIYFPAVVGLFLEL